MWGVIQEGMYLGAILEGQECGVLFGRGRVCGILIRIDRYVGCYLGQAYGVLFRRGMYMGVILEGLEIVCGVSLR